MPVVTMALAGAGNCAEVAGVPYVFARTEFGSFVLPARCRHRGGPLNLGRLESGGAELVCPWHEQSTSVTKLLRTSMPAVRRGNSVTVVFPGAGGHALSYRPLSPSLAAGERSEDSS